MIKQLQRKANKAGEVLAPLWGVKHVEMQVHIFSKASSFSGC